LELLTLAEEAEVALLAQLPERAEQEAEAMEQVGQIHPQQRAVPVQQTRAVVAAAERAEHLFHQQVALAAPELSSFVTLALNEALEERSLPLGVTPTIHSQLLEHSLVNKEKTKWHISQK
jgi:hypothetical protein